jgi:hypothetical protein
MALSTKNPGFLTPVPPGSSESRNEKPGFFGRVKASSLTKIIKLAIHGVLSNQARVKLN